MTATVLDALEQSLGWDHECVHLVHDPDSDLHAVIAIHSTVLGPALGGLRIRRYGGGLAEALDDALRLSRAMTLKASAAGLALGGGKAVMLDDGRRELRRARLIALAREVERLDGAYVTAEDIGTTTADMDLVAEHTHHVVGCSERDGRGGDPSPDTVRTVLAAIRTALAVLDGDETLAGRSVGVAGLGKVGGRLARWLLDAGARVVGYDPVTSAVERLAQAGMEAAPTLDALLARELDVLAPCAVGGMVDVARARELRCRVVCGSANNQLAGEPAAVALAERGILYVPDFLANCGGLIHAHCERRGAGPLELEAALGDAAERTHAILLDAHESGRLPSALAEQYAWARIERARAQQAVAGAGVG